MIWNKDLNREIPEGWGSGTLSDISSLTRGVTYNKDDIQDGNSRGTIPILRATNITRNQIDLNSMVYVSESLADEDQILQPFDILITMSSGSIDHIGKNGFYLYNEEVAFGAFCAKIQAKGDFTFYLYSYTQSDFFFTTIKNECLGTNINNLNGSMVKGFKLVVPDQATLLNFNQIVKSMFDKIRVNTNLNQQLSSLRDWLLPMLMNGQISVMDAEERVSEELGMVAEGERGRYEKK
jgi:type I restriction enzyme S subunit